MAGILPLVEAHSPIPIMGLCKLRACSHAFLETLGDLKARWQELRRDTLRRLRRALNGCLLPPRFQKRSIPRASWDLAFCREIENVHFPPSPFYGPGCSGGRQLSGTWRRRNPAEEAVVGWMQAQLVRERLTPRHRWACPAAGSLGLLGLCNCFWALLACTYPSKRQRCSPM